jgi:hypothetical protein
MAFSQCSLSLFLSFGGLRRHARKELLAIATRNQGARIDVVAHSFGTHLVAWDLQRSIPNLRPKIHTVIFAGSVLKSRFAWRPLLSDETVTRVINECGTRDNVLVLNRFFLLFTGLAGRLGFTGMLDEHLVNNWYDFGHNGFFVKDGKPYDEFMNQRWLPFLTSDRVPLPVDQRPDNWNEGLLVFLLQNAEPLKLLLYVSPIVAILAFSYSAHLSREYERRAGVARQLIGLAEGGLRDNSQRSLLLGMHALPITYSWDGSVLPEACAVLLHALQFPISASLLTGYVEDLAWNSDGKRLAIVSDARELTVWEATDGRQIFSAPIPTTNFTEYFTGKVMWHSYAPQIITCEVDEPCKAWNASTGTLEQMQIPTRDPVRELAWAPDGATIAVSDTENAVHILDRPTGREAQRLFVPGSLRRLSWDTVGRRLAVTFADGDEDLRSRYALAMWDTHDGKLLFTIRNFALPVNVRWNPDSRDDPGQSYERPANLRIPSVSNVFCFWLCCIDEVSPAGIPPPLYLCCAQYRVP